MRTIIISVLLCLSFVTHAEVYKCSDKNGKKTYQAMPCKGTSVKQSIVKAPDKVNEASRQEALSRLDDIKQENAANAMMEKQAAAQAQAAAIAAQQQPGRNVDPKLVKDLVEKSVTPGQGVDGYRAQKGAQSALRAVMGTPEPAPTPAPAAPKAVFCTNTGKNTSFCY